MAVDAIVRVSFESDSLAHGDVRKALEWEGPFHKVNTAVYECLAAPDADVIAALAALGAALTRHATTIDFLSVTLTRHDPEE
jgi:hypothetical protein